MRALGVWCQENNLSLNVNKTKEMIVDFRKQQRAPPIHIDGTAVDAGLLGRVAKKKPYLRLANKNKRLRWAKEHSIPESPLYF